MSRRLWIFGASATCARPLGRSTFGPTPKDFSMTFTEAALEVLKREGKPLHFKKITEIAIRESLLDHVGKIPEETMGGQLASHCRLAATDRRLIAVQPGTFALYEWGLDEDPTGLDGIVEPPPET